MSRERRGDGRGPGRARDHFNEARLHEPGEAGVARGSGVDDGVTSMRPGSMSRERRGSAPDGSPTSARHFNEARLHEPGEASGVSSADQSRA